MRGKGTLAEFGQDGPRAAADFQDATGSVQAAALEEVIAQRAGPGGLLEVAGMPVDHGEVIVICEIERITLAANCRGSNQRDGQYFLS